MNECSLKKFKSRLQLNNRKYKTSGDVYNKLAINIRGDANTYGDLYA